MNKKQVKLPGPDHPISIERNHARVIVSVAGRVIADTINALTLSPCSQILLSRPDSVIASAAKQSMARRHYHA